MATTLTGLVLLVCTAGLTGEYIFLALGLGFLAAYAVLKMTISQETKASEKPLDEAGMDNMESQELKEATDGEQESFRFAASVASTWIPSVVGDQKQKIFLKSGDIVIMLFI